MARWSSSWRRGWRRPAPSDAGDAPEPCGELARADPAGSGGDAGRQAGGRPRRVAARLAAGPGGGRLDPGVDPAQLQLFADGVEQSLSITGNGDAVFDRGEAHRVLRPGTRHALDGRRTYWLVVAGRPAKRVPLVVVSGERAGAGSFPAPRCFASERPTSRRCKNGDASNFFGDRRRPHRRDRVGDGHPPRQRRRRPGCSVVLQGVTAGNHQVAISLDGQPVGICAFAGQASQTCAISPVSVARGGERRPAGRAGGFPGRVAGGQRGDRLPAPVRRRRRRAQPDRAARDADRHRGVLVVRRAGDGRHRSDAARSSS